jgi:alpha-beta hydrolase superfamily lysophospholipase
MTHSWSIPGADSQPIIGDTHMPVEPGRGVIVICHGFKGYKDYGMFPRIALECACRAGLIAHRFNFSHSGMTNNLGAFERPDLFECDTWSKQVFDLNAVLAAIARGDLPGKGLPVFILGHSRGGVTAILAAGRLTYLGTLSDSHANAGFGGLEANAATAGVITLAAPAKCNPFTAAEQQLLLAQGWIDSPSSRTGQRLRVGRGFLQEQLDDPPAHDVLAHAEEMSCPMLVIHGECDATVPLHSAEQIVRAAGARATMRVIAGADHVFNTPNPMGNEQPSSSQLSIAIDEIVGFTADITGGKPPKRGRI